MIFYHYRRLLIVGKLRISCSAHVHHVSRESWPPPTSIIRSSSLNLVTTKVCDVSSPPSSTKHNTFTFRTIVRSSRHHRCEIRYKNFPFSNSLSSSFFFPLFLVRCFTRCSLKLTSFYFRYSRSFIRIRS